MGQNHVQNISKKLSNAVCCVWSLHQGAAKLPVSRNVTKREWHRKWDFCLFFLFFFVQTIKDLMHNCVFCKMFGVNFISHGLERFGLGLKHTEILRKVKWKCFAAEFVASRKKNKKDEAGHGLRSLTKMLLKVLCFCLNCKTLYFYAVRSFSCLSLWGHHLQTPNSGKTVDL